MKFAILTPNKCTTTHKAHNCDGVGMAIIGEDGNGDECEDDIEENGEDDEAGEEEEQEEDATLEDAQANADGGDIGQVDKDGGMDPDRPRPRQTQTPTTDKH